jgi:hypothetical protein
VVVQDWKKRNKVKIICSKMPKNKKKAVEDPLPAEDVGEDDELDDPPPAQPNPQV